MTSSVSGSQGYSGAVQNAGKGEGKDPSAATTGKERLDSLARSDGKQDYVPPDIEPASEIPQLPLPLDAKPQKGSEEQLVGSPQDLFAEKIKELLNKLEAKNSKLAEQVRFSLNHPEMTLKGQFSSSYALALKMTKEAMEYARNESGDSTFTPAEPDSANYDSQLASQKNALFESLLNNNKSLTAQEKNALLLTYYHPEIADKNQLPKNLQQLLAKYEAGAQKLFEKQGLAPSDYKIKSNSADFDMQNSAEFSSIFEEIAQENGGKETPPFGANEMKYLKYRLNHPNEANPPLPTGRTAEEMESFLKKALSEAQTAFTKETGYPANYSPSVNSEIYDANLLGRFEDIYEAKLASQSPPLTEEQKVLLRSALGQQPENVPKEIKALFEMIKGSALAEVIKAYQLPPSWQPKTRNLNDPAVIAQKQSIEPQLQAAKAAEEMVATMQNVVNQMNDPAARLSYSNYLLAVGDALNKFTESLFASATADSDAARKLTTATCEAQKDRIKMQQQQANEARKKEETAAKMMTVMSIFMSIFMGPIGIALAVQKQQTGTNFFEDLTKKIMTAIDKMDGSDGLKIFLKILAFDLLTKISFVVGGPMMAIQTFTDGFSKSVSNLLQLAGVPKDKADMAGMIVSTVVVMIAEIIATVLTGGAASASLVGSFGQIMNIVKSVAKTVVDAVKDILTLARTFISELPDLMRTASQIAKNIFAKLKTSCDELQTLMTDAQKAVNLAKKTPNAVNIAKADEAVQALTEKLKEVEKLASRLSQRLQTEARIKKDPGLIEAAKKAADHAEELKQVAADVEKMAADISKAANSGSESAQKLEKNIETGIKAIAYTSAGMTIIGTGVGASREILLGQVALIKAEMEADSAKIRAIVKLIKAVIDAIVAGISTTSETIKRVQETQANKFKDYNFVC